MTNDDVVAGFGVDDAVERVAEWLGKISLHPERDGHRLTVTLLRLGEGSSAPASAVLTRFHLETGTLVRHLAEAIVDRAVDEMAGLLVDRHKFAVHVEGKAWGRQAFSLVSVDDDDLDVEIDEELSAAGFRAFVARRVARLERQIASVEEAKEEVARLRDVLLVLDGKPISGPDR